MVLRNALGVSVAAAAMTAAVGVFGLAGGQPARAQDVDLDKVFRCVAEDEGGQVQCSEARGLLLDNCTLCHTFVPIVMQQFDADGWSSLLTRHVEAGRVDQLSDEQVQTIHDYLSANFNGDQPPPELPPALLETWTSY